MTAPEAPPGPRRAWDWPRAKEAGAHQPVRLGVIMLCHTELNIAAGLARRWVEGGAALAVHVDRRTPGAEVRRMRETLAPLPDVIWTPRRHCEWGTFSLVQATLDAATALLAAFPDVTHVLLVSGACLPLRPVQELIAYLGQAPERDYIESVTAADSGWVIGGLGVERFQFRFPVGWRRNRRWFDQLVDWQRRLGIRRRVPKGLNPHLGSQWWCLTRHTLDAILTDPRRAEYDRYFRGVWIPDESYFQTLARLHSAVLESRSLTLAKFDSQGKPYTFYNDHLDMLEESRSFIVRKVWPRAGWLLSHFPRPPTDPPQLDEPQPARIDRLINGAVARGQLGRPGLYMQSRFPAPDRENGKTAAPYALFQGFGDVMPGFQDWLAPLLPEADIHGHLFAPGGVEFAGGAGVGPGALSASAALRDHDPQGFLTSLIRIAPRTQVFQFSPRDNQKLNWFMATDPNARIAVITGAWALPLMRSGMPFDDIRRIAAQLQTLETAQLTVLRSVWTKARLQLWGLADFLADPDAVLRAALTPLGVRAVPPAPPLASTAALVDFLQALRNAGLRPHLLGEIEARPPQGPESRHA